jgi:hypothetical protein
MMTTEGSRRFQPELRVARQAGLEGHCGSGRWSSRSRDTAGRPGRALLAVRLPAALDAVHKSPAQTQRTRNARTPTRDAGRPHPDIGHRTRGHRVRGHWTVTPDTGHRTPDAWTRPTTRTGRLGTAGIRTDILDHHVQRTARWDAEPWTCGRRLRRSATMTARRGWGIRQRETTYRATRRLLGRSVGQAAPRRTALLGRFRVERRANGDASSVMAFAMWAGATGAGWCAVLTGERSG